jgi:hypothetical protein
MTLYKLFCVCKTIGTKENLLHNFLVHEYIFYSIFPSKNFQDVPTICYFFIKKIVVINIAALYENSLRVFLCTESPLPPLETPTRAQDNIAWSSLVEFIDHPSTLSLYRAFNILIQGPNLKICFPTEIKV